MSNIMILGGAGMLGLQLAKTLKSRDNSVYVIDNFSRNPHDPDPARRKWFLYNIGVPCYNLTIDTDPTAIVNLVSYLDDIDTVINCAADVGGVFYNRAKNARIFAKNAVLQSIPVGAAKTAGVNTFIQMSSVCVYEPSIGLHDDYYRLYGSHSETDDLGQISLDNGGYALAKRAGEMLAFASGIENVTVIRPTNMIGEFDYYDDRAHVVPALIMRALKTPPGEPLVVYSSPNVERDFLHSEGAANWIADILNVRPDERNRQVFNLPASTNGRMLMSTLADRVVISVALATGRNPLEIEYEYDREQPTEMVRRVDGSKITNLLIAGGVRDDMFIQDVIDEMVREAAGVLQIES